MAGSTPDEAVSWAAPVPPAAWADLAFFTTHWPRVRQALEAETEATLPPLPQIFAALEACPPERVRVVILGQDPYPTPGHADGFAFSVAPDVALPRSLGNIFAEMQDDLGCRPATGDLSGWARQGVLLLNTSLTVPAGRANGHRRFGWRTLAEQVLVRVSQQPTAFLLWGRPAQAMARHIPPEGHLIVETPHPSPLSARTGFFGSRPFSRVNAWLAGRGEAPVDWCGRLPFDAAAR